MMSPMRAVEPRHVAAHLRVQEMVIEAQLKFLGPDPKCFTRVSGLCPKES